MKLLNIFLCLMMLPGFAKAQNLLPVEENRAVMVRFFGGITGFDEAAYRTVKASIASLITEGVVAQFKTTQFGLEGGSEFCVELGLNPEDKIERVLKILQSIKPSDITVYNYDQRLNCNLIKE